MEGIKTWLSSQAYKNLFLDMTSASVPAVTMLSSSLSVYVFFIYNNFFHCFVNSSPEVTFQIALIILVTFWLKNIKGRCQFINLDVDVDGNTK
jgi:hypothetical protein